jgi:glycosyltransferase involved in cell wall biosynthesis
MGFPDKAIRSSLLRQTISDHTIAENSASVPQSTAAQQLKPGPRPRVRGKFFARGEEKLYLRGVTYGTFSPASDGSQFHDVQRVETDISAMAANGINAIRTYTVPPRWLLDVAQRHGIVVMVGIPWEQHMAITDDRRRTAAIERKVRESVGLCAGHPAVLCYSVGNEIPAPIVRWSGRKAVERLIRRLYDAAKEEDPEGIVTYVNYPTTEYLQLPFLDFVSFNVYLESQEPLQAYHARLQNIAGDRPLVMAEVGLDSRRNGPGKQACVLDWQIRTTFASGCAGIFVFAWTDEWFRGGHPIEDWDFGLTTRTREPKPALAAVQKAFAEVPFPSQGRLPRISVAICARNEEDHIQETLQAARTLDYPDYEVIVVDDGSTDATAAIARRAGVRVVSTASVGLSSARNIALREATGEIIAYLDGDAYPDPHWLRYLAYTFNAASHVGVGGPNILPCNDGPVAECVANAPGGPCHVLISDSEAEHIPGCNMAFRRDALLEIGGFDPQFRSAGDDVDVCWRLQERGWTLGFSPAAVVWHHRRDNVGDYWRQQMGYGKAEAMLERKWPEKYNRMGHLDWKGRLYGSGLVRPLFGRRRVYHGTWGSGLFQSLYAPESKRTVLFPLMPEWLILISPLAGLSLLSILWPPLIWALPLFVLANGIVLVQAIYNVQNSRFQRAGRSRVKLTGMRFVTLWLHLLQPMARLVGRAGHGLTPWRRRVRYGFMVPGRKSYAFWSEQGKSSEHILGSLEQVLRLHKAVVVRGGDYDRWDLEISVGTMGGIRLQSAIEEHGGGRQLVRLRFWCSGSKRRFLFSVPFLVLASLAYHFDAFLVSAIIVGGAILPAISWLLECGAATRLLVHSLDKMALGERIDGSTRL